MVTVPAHGFLFLRHGETDANARDIICGRTDLPLNAAGLAQAEAAALVLADAGIARIVTSPLQRAIGTAAAVARVTGLRPQIVAGLAERDWGAWEGQPRSTLRRDLTPPGGEPPSAFRDRIRSTFLGLDLRRSTLIVAHSGTEREIHALLTNAPHRRAGNAEIRVWSPERNGWECHQTVGFTR